MDLRWLQLLANVRNDADPTKPKAFTIRREPIYSTLVNDGVRQALSPVVFRLPKADADAATHVGLAVLSDNIMWPIAVNLR